MCKRTDLLQSHCCGRCPASSSRLRGAGCPSIVAHESKLQKTSVDPAVMRSGLWKNIQHQNWSDFGSEAERPETPADHSPFHWDGKLLQSKHTIYHQQLNQSNQSIRQSVNQSINPTNQPINHPINQPTNQSINQPINQSISQSIMIWNQTCRKQMSLSFIISSISLIVCERAEMCLLISSSFSFIICFFCSSSSLSAVIVAFSSSLRSWRSILYSFLIWCRVRSAWDWNQITST